MSCDRTDRFVGSMLGLALGDALGAPYEGGVAERLAWRAIGLLRPGQLRYTDDTEMAVGLAGSLVACEGFDADHVARVWADRAGSLRGYGPGALRVLRMIRRGVPWRQANRRVFPDGSFGNGAAMRAGPIGLAFADDPKQLDAVARQAAEITHAHRLGIDGGVLIARATAIAMRVESTGRVLDELTADDLDVEYQKRLVAARRLQDRGCREPRRIVGNLGHSVLAHESAVTAVFAASSCLGESFEQLMELVVAIGGDVDTIGAMAGSIWGAGRCAAALPAEPLAKLEDRERIESLGRRLAVVSENWSADGPPKPSAD